jgi:hypothetical protein
LYGEKEFGQIEEKIGSSRRKYWTPAGLKQNGQKEMKAAGQKEGKDSKAFGPKMEGQRNIWMEKKWTNERRNKQH